MIIVANHPNGLIDPVIVAYLAGREVRFLAKEPLFRTPLIGWVVRTMKALPVYRKMDGHDTDANEKTFQAVYDALGSGQAICLFPEGISHSEPSLQPLKTGAARMALGALAHGGAELALRILPVGLMYPQKQLFQSEAVAYIGESLVVPAEIIELYGREEREAVHRLTELIDTAIRGVTVNLDHWEDLPLLNLAGEIWADDGDPVLRLQAMADAQRSFVVDTPATVENLRRRLLAFSAQLKLLDLEPSDLDARIRTGPALKFALRNLVAILIGLPAAVIGALAYFPPYQSVRLISSWVKVDSDVVGTVKLLAAILFYGAWQTALVALGVATAPADIPSWWGGLAAMTLPFFGLYALRFAAHRSVALHQAAVALRMPFIPGVRRRLRIERDAIRSEIDRLADRVEEETETR
jgi:1-acyl-sn-glycerol-3-phosphate acyltransferase